MMSTCLAGMLLVSLMLAAMAATGDESRPRVTIELAVRDDGTATGRWSEGTGIAIGRDRAERLAREIIPLTTDSRAWLAALEEALPDITNRAADLVKLLQLHPLDATIVVGNRGSSDGFGWVPDFIGINVDAFTRTYGPPDSGAQDRMARIVAHEYLHLLTYANYPNHRELRQTAFERALWTIFFEGLGDYVSVSERWLPDDQGAYSPVATRTLSKLEPVFVDRLERLVAADESAEPALRETIAMGKFDEKWGSLPFALWLHSEAKRCGEKEVFRDVFRLERRGVLPVAAKYIRDDLRSRIIDLQARISILYPELTHTGDGCLGGQRDNDDRPNSPLAPR